MKLKRGFLNRALMGICSDSLTLQQTYMKLLDTTSVVKAWHVENIIRRNPGFAMLCIQVPITSIYQKSVQKEKKPMDPSSSVGPT
jgi:hypothetical protein